MQSHYVSTFVFLALFSSVSVAVQPSIEDLKKRPFLDDYYSNVVFGHDIVMNTPKYAGRYVRNNLKCQSCHIGGGTVADALPLNVAGIYPQWRSKNGKRNGLSLRIRECFFYSHNGIMPSNDAPETQAIAAYISYLSKGQVIGEAPIGRGMPSIPRTGFDPNPVNGRVVFMSKCKVCHGKDGLGQGSYPALWGPNSFNSGAGMNRLEKAAGFIWANMPKGEVRSLSYQEAWDVAAFITQQLRPPDPRKSKIYIFLQRILPETFLMAIMGQ